MIVMDIKQFPVCAGVYKMVDSSSNVIYVGKAKNLRKRIASYFRSSRGSFQDFKTQVMVSRIDHIDIVVTSNELEALMLESNLIKELRPKYNVLLKDDKSYPYIAVSLSEDYPRIFKTRSVKSKGYKYYGPFTEEYHVNCLVRFLNRTFKLRTCNSSKFSSRSRPCLYFDMGRCLGVCAGNVSKSGYIENVGSAMSILEGRTRELISSMEKKMKDFAGGSEFEKAAIVRDQIKGIELIYEKQVISSVDGKDIDVIAVFGDKGSAVVQVLFVRSGLLIGDKYFFLEDVLDDSVVVSEFISRFYQDNDAPQFILTSVDVEDVSVLSEWLSDKRGSKVVVRMPVKGDKKKLVDMAFSNAKSNFERVARELEKTVQSLEELRQKLGLDKVPERIHAFDISTLQGSDSTGSMVSFVDGVPAKEEYRRFKIRFVEGQDDFLMMKEVLYRQYSKNPLPDLILIDGGKGQLSSAVDVLKEFGYDDQPVISLAKKMEEVYVPFRKGPLSISKDSVSGHLLQRIRDEAHRFAVGYHRVLRSKRIRSE